MSRAERDPRHIPEWAQKERQSDFAWIVENTHVLWPAARAGYGAVGRGAVVVDTTTVVAHEGGAGNPMSYVTEAQIAQTGFPDALRLVREYDPSWEFVTGLVKPGGKESFYRTGIPSLRPRSRQ